MPLWGGMALVGLLTAVQLARFATEHERFVEAATTLKPVTHDRLRRVCKLLARDWRSSGEPFVVLPERDDVRAYGCHSEYDIPVVQSNYERRTWLRKRFEQGVPQD